MESRSFYRERIPWQFVVLQSTYFRRPILIACMVTGEKATHAFPTVSLMHMGGGGGGRTRETDGMPIVPGASHSTMHRTRNIWKEEPHHAHVHIGSFPHHFPTINQGMAVIKTVTLLMTFFKMEYL